MPAWRPAPSTSDTDMLGSPIRYSSARIASSSSWRLYASIFCMSGPSLGGRVPQGRDRRRRMCRRAAARGQDIGLRHAVAGQELLGIAPHAVLVDVEALELFLRGHAQADRLLAGGEDSDAGGEDECGDDGDAEGLHAELVETTAVEQARLADAVRTRECGCREETARERAPDPAHAMPRDGADRVVDPDAVDRDDSEDHENPGDQPDHARCPVLDVRTGSGDRDQAGDRAVAGEADVDRALERVAGDDGAEHAGGRGQGGGQWEGGGGGGG